MVLGVERVGGRICDASLATSDVVAVEVDGGGARGGGAEGVEAEAEEWKEDVGEVGGHGS